MNRKNTGKSDQKIMLIILSFGIFFSIASCKKNDKTFDASGSFEAEETLISAEITGTLLTFDIEEGQVLKVGEFIGSIDSTQIYLRKKQLTAQINAILAKKPNVSVQLAALEAQLNAAVKDQKRFTNLLNQNATTQKKVDDINAQIEVIKKQIAAQKSNLDISADGLDLDAKPMFIQIEQLNDQLKKCHIINPINGTVLVKYAEQNEMTMAGKPLYKIADLSNMILRVYVSGNQLSEIKLNQQIKVSTDDGKGGFKLNEGTIIWINDKAEFTPKTIQTKDERANMVYAVKVKIKNDGTYKIGMYGEVSF